MRPYRLRQSLPFGSRPAASGLSISGSVAGISDTGVTQLYDLVNELDEFSGIYEGTMDVNWLVLAQAKLGFALTDDLLVSAMGGLAWAGTEFSSSAGYSDQKVAQGYTVGAQVDYRLADHADPVVGYHERRRVPAVQ